jgi:hypothetical protein
MIDLAPKTKAILCQFPRLQRLWRDNIEAPVFPSPTPHEVCFYQGDSFEPFMRFVDGEIDRDLVKRNLEQPQLDNEPYTLLVVVDDIPGSLTVGEQIIIDHTDKFDMPQMTMDAYEAELSDLESQLEAAKLALVA